MTGTRASMDILIAGANVAVLILGRMYLRPCYGDPVMGFIRIHMESAPAEE